MVDEWKARPDRPVEVPLLHLQLSEQLERLRQEPTWRTSGRNAITLAKEPALRVVLMLLGKGTKISEHQAAEPLTFHVLTGSVTFRAGARVESLGSGELIVLESTVAHEGGHRGERLPVHPCRCRPRLPPTRWAIASPMSIPYDGAVIASLSIPWGRPRRRPSGNCFVIFVRRVRVLLAHA